jgi:hypothetical protein
LGTELRGGGGDDDTIEYVAVHILECKSAYVHVRRLRRE